MAPSCDANLRFGAHFESGNVARGLRTRESGRRQVIALISALYLSSPAIALEFCLDKGSAHRQCVCAFLKSSLHAWPHRVAARTKAAGHRRNNHRRGKRLLSGTKERVSAFARRLLHKQTHTNILLRARCFLHAHAPDEKGRICTMVWFAAPFPESWVGRNMNLSALRPKFSRANLF